MDFNKYVVPEWLADLYDQYRDWCSKTLPDDWQESDTYSSESMFLASMSDLIGYGWDGEEETVMEFVDTCNEILSDIEKNTPFYEQVNTIRNTILSRLAGEAE
ncbi:hypothetical protein [Methanospirillum sp.]|jgi:hypothetical protein|uniref:hypothetical protein n=1 Tax=Methanospirillum sp. TaxID=45200 RepID=UPI001BD37C0E|nr:hypothetical protein [Methanospirillum sp.]